MKPVNYLKACLYVSALVVTANLQAQTDYRSRYGHAEMNISCDAGARAAFERGLLQLHSFAWQQARDSFRDASSNAPDCAMAYWGEAMSYYDGLHEHPSADEVDAARAALARAEIAATQTDRESAYIKAAGQLFHGYPGVERLIRDRNYSESMQQIRAAYPDDDEASIFYALSLLSLARRGADDGLLIQAADILEPLFKKLPDHPGVAHYLIHAYDDSGERQKGIAAARVYAGIAPLMTHAQHMPSHIFAGIGMWPESNTSNAGALEANPYYYHSLMYLVYGHLQLGQWQMARKLVEELRQFTRSSDGGKAERRGLHSANTWLLLETHDWSAAAKAEMYSEAPLDAAETLYVRGTGAARSGDLDAATDALHSLNDVLNKLNEVNDSGIAVRAQLIQIQAKQVEALIAHARGNIDQAITILQQATALEDGPGVNRAPPDSGTGLPAHEVLGEILLDVGRYSEAQEHFETALQRTPNRLRSVLGLARAADRAGNSETAKREYSHLLQLLDDADPGFDMIAEARQYLSGR